MSNKKKILIISIIALVITIIGSTYAFFMYSKTTRAFTLTSGDIEIQFVNGENNINLTYAYPISDNYAKANLEKLGYIDFSVNGNITEDKKVINYEIYLEEDSKNTLDSNYIKVYLTDDTNKEIVSPKIYNSLDKTSYSNSTNGKVIYKVSKKGEFNDKYRIYVWIDSRYSQNVIQERFSFKVNLYAYNDNETAVSVIKSKLVKYVESSKEDFQGGLVAINTDGDLYNETDPSGTIREYRYSGPSVNNYVTFNDETWRIVGVFKEGNEGFLKIVRDDILDSSYLPSNFYINDTQYSIKSTWADYPKAVFWYGNSKNINDWTTAGIQYYLNNEQDNNSNPNYGYLHYLSTNAKNMIRDTIYYLGSVTTGSSISETPIESYNHEHDSNNILDGNKGSWTGKIGLMYPSDYGYSVNRKNWNELKFANYTTVFSNSWMSAMKSAKEYHTWFITPSKTYLSAALLILSYGNVTYTSIYNAGTSKHGRNVAVRPCLYLKSNVKIIAGDGSQNNPYKLLYEE